MAHFQYVALLRGINVGGGNVIKMADLKACFERCRLDNVATFIQSGNVVFDTFEDDPARVTRKLEAALSRTFNPYQGRIVVCSHAKLRRIVAKAPKGFGTEPTKYRYDVIYLRPPLKAAHAIKSVSTKEGVDQAFAGLDVLYFCRLIARASESRLARIVGLPIYRDLTIRNWNTTNKLLALMDARSRT